MPQSKLRPKQAKFIEEYLVDLNATQAAIRAGYSPKTADVKGSQLLSLVKLKQALALRQAEIAENTTITPEWVIQKLRENHDRAIKADPAQGSVVNRALELLGKHNGMFVERHEHTGRGGHPIQVEEVVVHLDYGREGK